MKRFPLGLLGAGTLALLLSSTPASAQLDDALSVLDPININGYLKPLQIGLGQTMGSGTYHGAAIATSGFSASLDLVAMDLWYQEKDRTYTASTPDGFNPPTQTTASTIVGDGSSTVVVGDGGAEYVFPGGFNLDNFFIGVPQLTLVFIPGTELSGRWISVSTGDTELGKVDYVAFGVRHNVGQYLTNAPVDIAVGGWYHQFDVDNDLMSTRAWQISGQVSKNFSVLTAFGGLGYEKYSSTVKYTSETGPVPEDVTVDMDSEGAVRFTAGANLTLSVVHLTTAFDYAKRVSLSFALGFGF